MPRDSLATFRQTIPRLASVIRNLRPTFHVPDISAITAAFLDTHDIEGVVWDVDGTLMRYHGDDIAPEFRAPVRAMFTDPSARHAILSNCDERRFRVLARIFPEIPVLRGYRTDGGPVFRRVLDGEDTHSPGDVERLLASGARQIRKPSGELVRYAMDEMAIGDPARVVMVGDQYFTDIASANLAGTRSVKVPTFARETFPPSIRFTQRFEALIFRIVHGPPSR